MAQEIAPVFIAEPEYRVYRIDCKNCGSWYRLMSTAIERTTMPAVCSSCMRYLKVTPHNGNIIQSAFHDRWVV